MNIIDLKPGDQFWFDGDWQTEPGIWEVVEHDADISMTRCEPITNPWEGFSAFFSRGVNVTKA